MKVILHLCPQTFHLIANGLFLLDEGGDSDNPIGDKIVRPKCDSCRARNMNPDHRSLEFTVQLPMERNAYYKYFTDNKPEHIKEIERLAIESASCLLQEKEVTEFVRTHEPIPLDQTPLHWKERE